MWKNILLVLEYGGHEFELTPGDGEGQPGVLHSPWGCKELDTTE